MLADEALRPSAQQTSKGHEGGFSLTKLLTGKHHRLAPGEASEMEFETAFVAAERDYRRRTNKTPSKKATASEPRGAFWVNLVS